MFDFRIDKRTIFIVLGIMLLLWIVRSGTAELLDLFYMLPGILVALTFHEYAHAFAADKLGDDTPRMQGRLNLNPISHIDPIGFVFLIVAGFGWGKPVQIDPRNFNGKRSLSAAEAIVAAAGPIMNFILAFIFLIIYYILFNVTNIIAGLSLQWQSVLYNIVSYAVSINVALGIFNLLPIPPLDGSKILMHFLPAKGKEWFHNNEQTFYIVFLIIWITGISGEIILPIFRIVVNGFDWIVLNIFKLLGLM